MSGAPWSVKGIDPKAREVAKDLARRSGMTLGEWLNRVILEDDGEDDAEPQLHDRLRGAVEPTRLRLVSTNGGREDMSRIALALDRLTDRIEASETRTGLAINGVEHSVRQVVARIDSVERESHAALGRFEAMRAEQANAAERLHQLESGPRSPEALRALEQTAARAAAAQTQESEARSRGVLADLGRRLADAETRTADALDSLRGSLAMLDQRIRGAEGGADPRFEALAASLAERVEQARADVARSLAATDAGRVDQRLGELTARVETAERRSGQAVERIGREVLSMAEVLNRRVQDAEARSAEAIARVGGEMARVASAVEDRLTRSEQVQADTLDRLGGEIGRMTERVLLSERRAAQAIDDVGEQVSRVTERIEQRQTRAADDLAERIRASEERTASLLDEARKRFEQRFGGAPAEPESAKLAAAPQPDVQAAAKARAYDASTPEGFAATFVDVAESPAEPEPLDAASEILARIRARSSSDFAAPAGFAAAALDAPVTAPASEAFAPIPEPFDDGLALSQPPPPLPMSDAPPGVSPLSTRDVIDQARAAARSSSPEQPATPRPRPTVTFDEPIVTRSFSGDRGGRAPNSTLQTALLVAGGAAFLSVGAAGVVLMEGPVQLPPETREPTAPAARPALTPPPTVVVPAPEAPAMDAPAMEAPAVPAAPPPPVEAARPQPQPAAPPTTATPRPKTPTAAAPPATGYAQAIAAVEAQRPGGLSQLRALADAGDARAQAYLGQLYENGRFGVSQSMTEARRWTGRAAARGDATSMHNLALYLFRGEGGPQDLPEAAKWFRSAGERGVVNSQYNLGLLYQSGSGVARDLGEAYKWFLIAAAGGDAQAKSNAVDLESRLSAQQIGQAERAADAFRAGRAATPAPAPAPPAPAPTPQAAAPAPAAANVQMAQKSLSRLGYYKGQQDGANSPAFKTAVTSYQRDQGLPATGALDQTTVSRLSVFAR